MRHEVYLKARARSEDAAIENINGLLIGIKSGAHVSGKNILRSEKIPCDGLDPFQEYLYTIALSIEMPESLDVRHLTKIFARSGIGVLESLDGRRSVMIDESKIKMAEARLAELGMPEGMTKEALGDVFRILSV